MVLRLILVIFILQILNSELKSSTAPPFIEFEEGSVTLTEEGKTNIDSLGKVFKNDKEIQQRLNADSLVFYISAVQSKQQLENKPCLSLMRFREVQKKFIMDYGMEKHHFRSSLEGYVLYKTEDLKKQGLNVIPVPTSSNIRNENNLPYDFIKFDGSDNEKLEEIGSEIRCEYDFFESLTIFIIPHISKKEYNENPCLAFEKYLILKEYFKLHYNLEGIKFHYKDVKYGYDDDDDETGFILKISE